MRTLPHAHAATWQMLRLSGSCDQPFSSGGTPNNTCDDEWMMDDDDDDDDVSVPPAVPIITNTAQFQRSRAGIRFGKSKECSWGVHYWDDG
jgi:hypothetical protein